MKICIYGASSNDIDTRYIKAGEQFGSELASAGHGLVFGGGAGGMMGAVARGTAAKNGEIIGVAPKFFNVDGMLFDRCSEMIYTDTMRERKQIMEEKADAFVMLPGGIGTFDEFFEILTLKQLGRHAKPIGILNVSGYYNNILAMLQKAIDEKFMLNNTECLFSVSENGMELISELENQLAAAQTPMIYKKLI